MSKNKTEVKFLAFIESQWVLVLLTDSNPVKEFGGSRPTDEGYSSWASQYTLGENGVFAEHYTGGRDCDGRLDQFNKLYCPLSELEAETTEDFDTKMELRVPAWVAIDSHQRDYSAEAAGY